MSDKTAESIYQVKITLRDSKPPIWRRLLAPGNSTLYKLHDMLQIAMGWTDSHLHQFIIQGEYYGVPSPEDWLPVKDERRFRLNRLVPCEKSKFIYEYDFGDSWEHVIVVEKILSPEPGVKYPLCIKGKRACPPEDVGGIWGYVGFLEAIGNPGHEEHDSYLEWVGGEFDAEAFDIEEVNRALQRSK